MALVEDGGRAQKAGIKRGQGGPGQVMGRACAAAAEVMVAPGEADHSAGRLARLCPELSSHIVLWPWQRRALLWVMAGLAAAALLNPSTLAVLVTLVLAIPFFSVYALRFVAAAQLVSHARRQDDARNGPSCAEDAFAPDGNWPTYAVLVPLHDEADVVPGLLQALSRLQYPHARLAIRLVVEEDDPATRAALANQVLPAHMRVLVVPRGTPQTKPRALAVALDQTPGDFVVVFDAEDLPEPDQLRRAVALFGHVGDDVVCLQARLNTFNPNESWLARQFSVEYSALFDVMLPMLQRLGLPLPLGGTSNHFRRAGLERALGWDPHNVTEDADLGIRLARMGMRVGVLSSTTWEEAPHTFAVWLGQRTRWLKGWMQTYAVHMRRPLTLLREIGWWPFFGLQILMGAMIASALVHPWFYLLLGYAWWGGELFGVASSGGARALWLLALANLVLGYVSIVLIGGVAVWRRGRGWLIPHLVLVPFYWLGISLAAYRALWELAVAPSYWAKTVHRSRGHVRGLVDDDPGCAAAFRAELSGDSVSELARLER